MSPAGERHLAACRFIAAADRVRVLALLAQRAGLTADVVPRYLVHAVRDAERACADLQMWPRRGLAYYRKIGDRA